MANNQVHLHDHLRGILSQLPQYIRLSNEVAPNLKWSVSYHAAEDHMDEYGYIVEFRDKEKVLFDVKLGVDSRGEVQINGGLTDESLVEGKPSFRLLRLFVSPDFNRFFKVRKNKTLKNIYRLSSALNISQCSRSSIQDYFTEVVEQITLFINVLLDDIPHQRLAL